MKISIITPVYNGEKYIAEAIKSVLNQKGNFEIEYIVVDGKSTDSTLSIVDDFHKRYEAGEYKDNCLGISFTYISEPDEGMYDALKKGFQMCTGDIVAWINADDYYLDGAFEKVTEAFEQLGEVDWVIGRGNMINAERQFVFRSNLRYYPQKFILNGGFGRFSDYFIPQESTFWRKNLFETVDMDKFATYRLAGDFYLWFSFAQSKPAYSLDEDLAIFRKTDSNLSMDKSKYREVIREIMNHVNNYSDRDRVLLRSYGEVWKAKERRDDKYFPYICKVDDEWKIIQQNNKSERERKTVSIITVCRNEENVRYTCESIVNQTWNNYEWIVIDGASTDGTLDIIKEYEANIDVLISEPDKGIYNAMNKGIQNATGEWLIFMNGGDQFHDFKVLERIFKGREYEADILYGDEERYDVYGKTHIYKLPQQIPPFFMCYQAFAHQAMFYRRELFEKYGGYDESYKITADSEKNTMFLEKGVVFRKIYQVVSSYVLDGLSNNKEYSKLLDEERKRRRLQYYSPEDVDLYKWGVKQSTIEVKIPLIKVKSFHNGKIKKYYLFGALLLFTAKRAY